MIAYVDASILLRVALFQPGRLPEWPTIEQAVTSALRDRVDASPAVLRRAAHPFSTSLGTLDASPLAPAVLWREGRTVAPALVKHDAQLATAARATRLATAGV